MTTPIEHDSHDDVDDILIVDDEVANLKLLSEILVKGGYRVRPANRPQLAIDSAISQPPKLILLDVKMPEMDGFEVCRHLKQDDRTRDIPVLFVSALRETRDKVTGFEAGAVDFISKPFDELEVLARVRTHVNLRNLQYNLEKMVVERTAELTKSEQLARLLLNATTDVTHLIDEDGTILDLNDAMAARLGATREKLIGSNVFDRLPPGTATARKEWLRQALFEGKTLRFVDRASSDVIYDVGIYPIATRAGEKNRFVVFAHDITDSEKALQALKVSEEQLQEAQRMAKIGSWSWDLNSGEVQWSRNLYEIVGLNPKDPAPAFEDHVSFFTPESWATLSEAVQRATKVGEPYDLELGLVRTDGQLRFGCVQGEAVSNSDGQSVMLQGTVQDITASKRAQEALRESEARLREAQRLANLGSWELDLLNDGLVWSEEVFRIFEIDSEEFGASYEAFLEAVHPEDRALVDRAYTESVEARKPYQITHRVLMKDGRIKFVHERGETFYSPEGRPLRSVGTVQDITERTRWERDLLASERKYRTVIEQAQEAIVVLQDSQRKYYNPAWLKMTGYAAEEYDSVPFLSLVHSDDRALVEDVYRRILTGPDTEIACDFRIQTNSGQTKWLSSRSTKIEWEGEPAGMMFIEDVTERKQAEEEIKQLRDEYTHIARVSAMGELVASLAHELKQPLAAIRSNAQAAQRFLAFDEPDIDELHEILKDIIKDDRRADNVIQRLRALMQRRGAQMARLDINEVIREIMPLLNSYQVVRDISLRLDLNHNVARVYGDRVQLQQVLLNLILNSSEALLQTDQAERCIVIQTQCRDNASVTVSVTDNGPGIDEAVESCLFEPFRSTKKEGLGMGLAISQSIIVEHHGCLQAHNNPDGGATFYFTIPLAGESQA